MDRAKVMQLTIPQNKRIICISDIHGQLDVFKKLLVKVGFCDDDVLILLGDLCAGRYNNSQSRHTLEFLLTLCEQANVFALRGNWDTVERLPEDWDETVKVQAAKWFESLPHIIETKEFIFVHGGISSNNLKKQEAQRCVRELSNKAVFKKYVVVGHSPTLNYSGNILSCNPIINKNRRIISIDGGLDTWGCGQLNAFIIQNGTFSHESCDNLPVIHAETAQPASGGELSIVWVKDKVVELIAAGEEFSIYRHTKSGRLIELANISINTDQDGELWCALDTDYYLPVDVGDELTVLHTFSDRIYAKKDGVIGYYKRKKKVDYNKNVFYKRLPLERASNVRDIGGYLANCGVTKWKTFLRGEGLENISDNDAAFLYQYGIRTVIDLRTPSEFEINNTEYLIRTFASNGITHRNIPFFDDYNNINKHFYIHMIENGAKNIKQLFEYIGERLSYGGILYNCFMGKDRTGVLSALLLLLCGVSELDVLADYMVSSVYLKSLSEKLGLSGELISSKPEFMEEFLIYLKKHYTSSELYLLSIGVSRETISVIKDRFICRELVLADHSLQSQAISVDTGA